MLALGMFVVRVDALGTDPSSAGILAQSPALNDTRPARPAPLPALVPAKVPSMRNIDVGADIALATRTVSKDASGNAASIHYPSAIGVGFRGDWNLIRHLAFGVYVVRVRHDANVSGAALGVPDATVDVDPIRTYALGVRVSPKWRPLPRLDAWLSAGIGWGVLSVSRATITPHSQAPFVVRERSDSFAEVPIGLGVSYEVLPRWLSVRFETTGAFVWGQEGTALRPIQAIDALGHKREMSGFPRIDASFVQTLGLSLIL